MGLTNSSVGIRAVDSGLEIRKQSPDDKVIALAGNPNVGKSTVFNAHSRPAQQRSGQLYDLRPACSEHGNNYAGQGV